MTRLLKTSLVAGSMSALLLATPAIAQDPGVSDSEIVVGAIMPFTGSAGALGYASMLGERIAVEEINAAGGINGRMIKFIAEDDDYVPSRTVQAFAKLMDVDQIFALAGGSGSTNWLAIMPTLEEEGIPNVNPLLASMTPFEVGPNTHFGIGTSYRDGAYEVMHVLAELYPGLKWASLVQNDESGIDREVGFSQAAEELGLEVVLQMRADRSQTDYSAEVLRMQEAGATGVLLGGLPTLDASVLREIKRLNLDVKVGTLWLSHNSATLDLIGNDAKDYVLYDFIPSLADPKLAGFNALAAEHLSVEDVARMNRYSVAGYATMKVLIEAMQQCGAELTRACTLEQLNTMTDFDTGVMGKVSFTPEQHLAPVAGAPLTIDAANKVFVPLAQ